MKNNSKGIVQIIIPIILAIAIVAGIGYFAFKNGQMKTIVQTDPYSPSLSDTWKDQLAPTSDLVKNWETYTNEEYGFESKYNPESRPTEYIENETTGQFSYLLLIKYGTNPIKFPSGYELRVNKQQSLDEYRSELIGHSTDKINSEKEVIINANIWTKINYQIFLTTDYIPITTAITNRGGYSYAITSPSLDIDQILSTFRFLDKSNPWDKSVCRNKICESCENECCTYPCSTDDNGQEYCPPPVCLGYCPQDCQPGQEIECEKGFIEICEGGLCDCLKAN